MQAIGALVQGAGGMLERVPATFWGVVAGSFFTLIGIARTNRAAAQRQRGQLEHAMRKEVYLGAAEGISAILVSFGRFADPNVPFDELNKVLNDRIPLISRAQLIAGPDVHRHMTNLAFEIAAVFQRLVLRRLPLAQMQQRIDQLSADNDVAVRGQDQMLEEMKQFHLAGDWQNQTKCNFIRDGFAYEVNRVTETIVQ
jgi:hypothetical protein